MNDDLPTPTARGRSGLTFLEVLGATVVLGLAVVASSWALSATTGAHALLAGEPISAALLAGQIHELALDLSREPSGLPIASRPDGVLALDTLDGAVFSPPIDAARNPIPSATGWAQQVDLGTVALDGSLAAPPVGSYDYPDAMGTQVVQLDVRITQLGQDRGTYTWWIQP